MKQSIFILFPCLIYKLYLELGVKSLYILELLIEVQCTLDVSLIKAEENSMAIWRALYQPAPMPKMFVPKLHPEVPPTTTAATNDRSPQTTTTPAP